MTYFEQSNNNKLSITLQELGFNEESVYGFTRTDELDSLFCDLIVYTPTDQSHYGKKFDSYIKLSKKAQDNFLKSVFNGLGIKKIYLYRTYNDRTRNKNNLHDDVMKETEPMLCLRCDNGVPKSLYMAVRNALAHGNIIQKDKHYILYSVSDDQNEYTSNITFFLKITKLSNLMSLVKTLLYYD